MMRFFSLRRWFLERRLAIFTSSFSMAFVMAVILREQRPWVKATNMQEVARFGNKNHEYLTSKDAHDRH